MPLLVSIIDTVICNCIYSFGFYLKFLANCSKIVKLKISSNTHLGFHSTIAKPMLWTIVIILSVLNKLECSSIVNYLFINCSVFIGHVKCLLNAYNLRRCCYYVNKRNKYITWKYTALALFPFFLDFIQMLR